MIRLWQERSEREKIMLAGLGGVLALVILFQFLWQPLMNFRASSARSYEAARAVYAEVDADAVAAQALKARESTRTAVDRGSLRSIITRTARAADLSLSRLEPDENGTLSVWFGEARSPKLHGWIASLYENHGIVVTKANLDRRDDGDGVRAQFTFGWGQG